MICWFSFYFEKSKIAQKGPKKSAWDTQLNYSILSKKLTKHLGLIWNTSRFLRLYAGTIHESNTSHAWAIHSKNTPFFKAPRVGSMSWATELGEEVGSTIRVHESDNPESNAEQFLVLGLHGLGEWVGWMCRVHDLGQRVGSMSQVHKWDQW